MSITITDLPTIYPPSEWIDSLVHTLPNGEVLATYATVDDGLALSNPLDDDEGVEYAIWDRAVERDGWLSQFEDNEGNVDDAPWFDNPRFFWIDRYEHGLVRYSIHNGPPADRWDTALKAGYIIVPADVPDECAKSYAVTSLETYTDWCNGNVYGIVTERFKACGECGTYESMDEEAVWGCIGSEYAADEVINQHGWNL